MGLALALVAMAGWGEHAMHRRRRRRFIVACAILADVRRACTSRTAGAEVAMGSTTLTSAMRIHPPQSPIVDANATSSSRWKTTRPRAYSAIADTVDAS